MNVFAESPKLGLLRTRRFSSSSRHSQRACNQRSASTTRAKSRVRWWQRCCETVTSHVSLCGPACKWQKSVLPPRFVAGMLCHPQQVARPSYLLFNVLACVYVCLCVCVYVCVCVCVCVCVRARARANDVCAPIMCIHVMQQTCQANSEVVRCKRAAARRALMLYVQLLRGGVQSRPPGGALMAAVCCHARVDTGMWWVKQPQRRRRRNRRAR